MLEKLDIYMQNNQTGLLSHTIYQKKKNPPNGLLTSVHR